MYLKIVRKIQKIIAGMGGKIVHKEKKIINSIVEIPCCQCKALSTITAGAVYKQFNRGHNEYICKSCASTNGWTSEKREKARDKSKKNWGDPNYAGTIIGKNIAAHIKKLVKPNFLD